MKPYFEEDGIRIYHADCRDILPYLEGIACTVTSPPYNQMAEAIKPSGMWAQTSGGRGFVDKWNAEGYFDSLPEDEYQRMQNQILELVAGASLPDASLFYNHQCRWRDKVLIHPVDWVHPQFWNLHQEIIWARNGGMMLNSRKFCRFDERILWFHRGDEWKWNQEATSWGSVWHLACDQGGKEHPVAYPLEIPARCIAATTYAVSDTVLDPFCGSGTTLRAAKDLGRNAIGIEISEAYCEIASRKLSQKVLVFGESDSI